MNDFPIVFYDGDCGFCNSIVGLILKYEKTNDIHFAALQSPVADKMLKEEFKIDIDLSTFYYLDKNHQLHSKSKGFFELAKSMKAPLRWLTIFRFFPSRLTDSVYDWVAKRRRSIISQHCYLPTPEQRKRFVS